jgi:hypothetical protein
MKLDDWKLLRWLLFADSALAPPGTPILCCWSNWRLSCRQMWDSLVLGAVNYVSGRRNWRVRHPPDGADDEVTRRRVELNETGSRS